MKFKLFIFSLNFVISCSELYQEPNDASFDIPYHVQIHTRLVNSAKNGFHVLFVSLLQQSIEQGINLINDFDITEQKTLLMHASENGSLQIVQHLILLGANLDLQNKKQNSNDSGWTAIMYALNNDHDAVFFELLINNANPHVTNDFNKIFSSKNKCKLKYSEYKKIKNEYNLAIQAGSNMSLLPDLAAICVDFLKY